MKYLLPDGYEEWWRSGVIILARHVSGSWTTFEARDGQLHDAHTFCAKCPDPERQAREDFALRVKKANA